MLNKLFSDIPISDEDTSFIPNLPSRYDCSPMCSVESSAKMFFAKLISLNPYKSPGPDGCHPRILKTVGSATSSSLSNHAKFTQ